MSDEPTQEELLEWLAELADNEEEIEPGTFTTGDWTEKFTVSDKKALRTIKELKKQGIVESCKTRRPNVHGMWQGLWGFRYVGNKPE